MRIETKKKLDLIFRSFLVLTAFTSILVTIGIVVVLLGDTIRFFNHPEGGGFPSSLIRFFTEKEWTPTFVTKKIGVLPLLCGTFLIAGIAMCISIPLGLLIAVYLSEFASHRVREAVKPWLDFLEAIPTVVYGYFALLGVTPLLQWFFKKFGLEVHGMNALSPGIVLGVMILPFTASLVEDSLRGVPSYLREASYSLGASRLKTAFGVVIPAAKSGIIAAYLLGASRAVGETMVVAIAAGMYPNLTLNPLEPVQTITGYIVQVALGDLPFLSFEYLSIFAAGFLLFSLSLFFNLMAIYVKSRVERY